jgi:DeoR/GlpR family transcriptional regulator of sugar metabolism
LNLLLILNNEKVANLENLNENIIESTPAARRSCILNSLNETGEIRVTHLSRKLNASVVTIRKDLDMLEKEGLLERVHGGAVKNSRVQYNASFLSRMDLKKTEKKAIAAAAANLVSDGDSIIINVGSTSMYVTQALKDKKKLIVITNALSIFNEIAYYKDTTCFFLGGRFDQNMMHTYGDDTIEQLSKYNADKLFIGMDGIDIEAGATTYNHVEEKVMHMMMERSKEKILIVDDTKIKRVSFAYISPLSSFDKIITNFVSKHKEFYKELEDLGLEVITV